MLKNEYYENITREQADIFEEQTTENHADKEFTPEAVMAEKHKSLEWLKKLMPDAECYFDSRGVYVLDEYDTSIAIKLSIDEDSPLEFTICLIPGDYYIVSVVPLSSSTEKVVGRRSIRSPLVRIKRIQQTKYFKCDGLYAVGKLLKDFESGKLNLGLI